MFFELEYETVVLFYCMLECC